MRRNVSQLDIRMLSGVFPKEHELTIASKSRTGFQAAANTLQWHIIDGLEAALGAPVPLFNAMFVGSYPFLYRDIILPSCLWRHRPDVVDHQVGFLNLYGVKHLWRAWAVARALTEWARDGAVEKRLLVYSAHSPFLYAAAMAKRVNPDIGVFLVVPDLPEFMRLGETGSPIYRLLKILDLRATRQLLNSVDGFILLTSAMAERIEVGARPHIVMEGIVHERDARPPVPTNGRRVLVYTGALHREYGILELLSGFSNTADGAFRLVICGSGGAEADVRRAAGRDERITFLGQVPRERAVEIQQNATALINPRGPNDEYTRYSFPSKNMEYLLSGRPLISYRLAGVPSDYDPFIYYIRGNGPTGITDAINQTFFKPDAELDEFGAAARRFVLTHKSHRVQGARILDLLRSGRRGSPSEA